MNKISIYSGKKMRGFILARKRINIINKITDINDCNYGKYMSVRNRISIKYTDAIEINYFSNRIDSIDNCRIIKPIQYYTEYIGIRGGSL